MRLVRRRRVLGSRRCARCVSGAARLRRCARSSPACCSQYLLPGLRERPELPTLNGRGRPGRGARRRGRSSTSTSTQPRCARGRRPRTKRTSSPQLSEEGVVASRAEPGPRSSRHTSCCGWKDGDPRGGRRRADDTSSTPVRVIRSVRSLFSVRSLLAAAGVALVGLASGSAGPAAGPPAALAVPAPSRRSTRRSLTAHLLRDDGPLRERRPVERPRRPHGRLREHGYDPTSTAYFHGGDSRA